MSLQPQWVRSIRTGVRSRQDRMRSGASARPQQFGSHAQPLVLRMPRRNIHALPRVARTVVPHLIGEGLEAERVVGGGEGAGEGFRWRPAPPGRAENPVSPLRSAPAPG